MMPDSNSTPPQPPDDEVSRSKKSSKGYVPDEESVDFSRLASVEDGASAAVSFTSRQGPLSGSSVVSWDELVRQQGTDGGEDVVLHERGDGEDFDPISDQDLLREVLADEPPPSGIILKDPSHHEMPVLPANAKPPAKDADNALGNLDQVMSGASAGSFVLPPELRATRPAEPGSAPSLPPGTDDGTFHVLPTGEHVENSSVLGLPAGPDSGAGSGVPSDVWGESSHVDLLGAKLPGVSSGSSLPNTDDVAAPPVVPPADDLPAAAGEAPAESETSAVDLNPDSAGDLPFPLGVDSSVGNSSVLRSRRPAPRSDGDKQDSGTVDLLNATSSEFDLDLRPGTSSLRPGADLSTADLPATVPLVPAGKGRAVAWVGGGLAGLLAGVAACAGFWYAGYVPATNFSQPVQGRPVDGALANALKEKEAAQADTVKALEQAQKLQANLDKLNASLKKANLNPANLAAAGEQVRKTQDELDRLNGLLKQANIDPSALPDVARQLAQARAAAEQAKQAQAKLNDLAEQLQKAKAAAQAAPAGPDKAAEAQIAQLRDRLTKAEDEARVSEARLKAEMEQLAASQKSLAGFTQEVARRLQSARLVAPNAPPAELLAGLDRALQRRPDGPAALTPEQASHLYSTAWSAFAAGDYWRAEHDFAAVADSGHRNAVACYFLGLARLARGRSAEADQAFRQGVALERQNLPNAQDVDRALERLPLGSRQYINRYRYGS
jgi:hypothetical protein